MDLWQVLFVVVMLPGVLLANWSWWRFHIAYEARYGRKYGLRQFFQAPFTLSAMLRSVDDPEVEHLRRWYLWSTVLFVGSCVLFALVIFAFKVL